MTGTRDYQVNTLHQHIPQILHKMFARTLLCIYDDQPTNRKKQKQLTQTKHHHTLTLKTNIQHNPKMMMKTKTRDPQFKKLQQNQTKNKQEANGQSRITKTILKKTFNKQTSPLEKQEQTQQNQNTKLITQHQLWTITISHNCQKKQKRKTTNSNR